MKILKNEIFKYSLCISLLYITLFLITSIFESKSFAYTSNPFKYSIEKRTITKEDENYKINVHYPKINDKKIDNEITNYIYKYTSSFLTNDTLDKTLNINYEVHFSTSILNIFFTIDNSLNKNIIYKSFNYNLNEDELVINEETKNQIINYINKKYSNHISSTISTLSHDEYATKFTDKGIHYYFNYDLFENINYTPELYIDYRGNIILENENEKKYSIAFTFDDGPSEYTDEFVDTLKLNNATSTFFMLGNRMKYNESTVLYAYNNGMEIASHSYSHKNLNAIKNNEIESEVNSTTIIFNEITNDDIKLFRPPYGNANENARKFIPFPIITWNIDPEDWLYRDANKTYEHIIDKACDGCIVLMHDLYPETLEAIKMAIPELNEMGYEITSVSELAKKKEITLLPGNIYRSFYNYNMQF